MHIVCTRGTPKADMLDHLPTVPLLLEYLNNDTLPEQDELWIYHILRLPGRVRYISLNLCWDSDQKRQSEVRLDNIK